MYTVTNLSEFLPVAINNKGEVAGNFANHAFLYDRKRSHHRPARDSSRQNPQGEENQLPGRVIRGMPGERGE
jgi:hypothetical protein